MSSLSAETSSSLAPAVSRAVRILDALSQARGVEQSLADLSRTIGAAKSSTSNICAVLEEANLIQKREYGYVLGRATVELGGAYLATFDQVREFYRLCANSPVLRGELLQLGVLDGTDVIYLARHEGTAPLRLTAGVGDRFPASITAIGNALLMALSSEEVALRYKNIAAFPVMTSKSTTTFPELEAKLARARERGYALDEGEVFPNVVGVAMPIPPRRAGEQPLAIGVSMIGPGENFTVPRERFDAIVDALAEAVENLTNPMSQAVIMNEDKQA
ncbi:IclR family transcriptional regulator [Arcanobacterium haemolyticum]|nr:IclR family transcriptional regulator [Arcanobacterium haemolyticum]